MPNYDYECTHCGHTFEAFQNISAPHIARCPKCGKKLRRLIGGGAGLIFKGSGFYATDYKKPFAKEADVKAPPSTCPAAKTGGCSGCPSSTNK